MRTITTWLLLIDAVSGFRAITGVARPALLATSPYCVEGGTTAGKGFGAKKRGSEPQQPNIEMDLVSSTSAPQVDGRAAAEERGRAALEKLRKNSGTAKPKRVNPYLTPEELEPIDPSAGVMPQVVADRMMRRVAPFAGLPILFAMCSFAAFYYANTQLDMKLPPQVVAYTTQFCVLLSFAGITWGVMSTSWDEETEGSVLGAEQFSKNLNIMRGGEEQRREAAKTEYAEV